MSFQYDLFAIFQIVLIDLAMAGDNAIAVGMAASGLPRGVRHHAIISGIVVATALRILFAVFAVQILRITGFLAAGGLLLLWVAWKMFEEIRHAHKAPKAAKFRVEEPSIEVPHKKLSSAIWQIVLADVSMSLDNVLAVAGVARNHTFTLVAGLSLSVLLMGVGASFIGRLTARYAWIAWIGLAIVLFTALRMIGDGAQDILHVVNN